jgi:hypothetical protein
VKFLVVKRFAPAVLAFGIAVSGVGVTGATAFASTTHAATVKEGAKCSKAELNKTEKAGSKVLVCKKAGGGYKWTVKKK